MKLDAYVTAALPPKYTIWGLDLKDICLGHYFLMKRFGSNYASDEEAQVDIIDLLIGIIVCSKTFEEGIAFFNQAPIPFFSWRNIKSLFSYFSFVKIKKDGFSLIRNRSAWGISRKHGGAYYEINKYGRFVCKLANKNKINIMTSFRTFQRYLEDGRKMPLYWENHSDPNGNGRAKSHWSINVYNVLVSKLNYTPSDAYNLPLSKAFYEYAKYAESEGSIELFSDDEEELLINTNEQRT